MALHSRGLLCPIKAVRDYRYYPFECINISFIYSLDLLELKLRNAQDENQCRALVNTVMNLMVPRWGIS